MNRPVIERSMLEAAPVDSLLEILPVLRLCKLALDEPQHPHLAKEARAQIGDVLDAIRHRLRLVPPTVLHIPPPTE